MVCAVPGPRFLVRRAAWDPWPPFVTQWCVGSCSGGRAGAAVSARPSGTRVPASGLSLAPVPLQVQQLLPGHAPVHALPVHAAHRLRHRPLPAVSTLRALQVRGRRRSAPPAVGGAPRRGAPEQAKAREGSQTRASESEASVPAGSPIAVLLLKRNGPRGVKTGSSSALGWKETLLGQSSRPGLRRLPDERPRHS